MSVEKTLSRRDLVLYSVSAILLLDTVAASAAIGVSSLFWWLVLGVVFFLPYSMISAELGCAYPDQGGIYAWVKRAFGARWGARITWSYWVNITVWAPSLYILFSGIFAQLFWPDMPLSVQIGLGIALTWLTVWANIITLDVGKWVPNLGALIKILVFMAVIVGGYQHFQANGMANDISWQAFKPSFSGGVQYIPVILYGMLGFELVSASSQEMSNPSRDVAAAINMSGLIIFGLYFLATLAVLVAIPFDNIDLVEGLVDTLRIFYGGSDMGQAFVLILAVGTLYTLFSNAVTWSLGGNRALAEAAVAGEMPALLAVHHPRRETPVGAAVAFGILCTIILLLYGAMAGSNEDLFWQLFAFSGVIFMIPYVAMMAAFVKLREVDSDHPRPYRVKGGAGLAYLLAFICAAILTLTIFLFLYVPEEGVQVPILVGTIILLVLGELAIVQAHNQKMKR